MDHNELSWLTWVTALKKGGKQGERNMLLKVNHPKHDLSWVGVMKGISYLPEAYWVNSRAAILKKNEIV